MNKIDRWNIVNSVSSKFSNTRISLLPLLTTLFVICKIIGLLSDFEWWQMFIPMIIWIFFITVPAIIVLCITEVVCFIKGKLNRTEGIK